MLGTCFNVRVIFFSFHYINRALRLLPEVAFAERRAV